MPDYRPWSPTSAPLAPLKVRKRIFHLSGGISSWAGAERTVVQDGRDGLTLLFADTRIEDEDSYRFLIEGAAHVMGIPLADVQRLATWASNLPLVEEGKLDERCKSLDALAEAVMKLIPGFVWIADGRDPWRVYRDERFLGNSRIDPCSKHLKRLLLARWCAEHCEADAVHMLGLDWSEPHRIANVTAAFAAQCRTVEFPLSEPPIYYKHEYCAEARKLGIEPPRLYAWGFSHGNCGGFCCKAGQASMKLLLNRLPERYAWHERQEQDLRRFLGRDDISILTSRKGGQKRTLTLEQFRESVQAGQLFDGDDWGTCSCFALEEVPGA